MSSIKSSDLHRIFEQLDRDGDGHVSIEELHLLLKTIGNDPGPDKIESIMGRRSLDESEFIVFYQSLTNEQKKKDDRVEDDKGEDDEESDLVEAFKVFDLNKDGFITADELQSVLSSLGLLESRRGADCMSMITKFDANSDGQVDLEEFKKMMSAC